MNERLFFLREDKDLTQNDLAEIFNVDRSLISKWERNLNSVPLKQLNKYANYFNVSLDYLIGLTDSKEPTKKLDELDNNIVGQRIVEIRKNNNLTLRDIAKVLNTSSSTISEYETGKNLIQLSFAIQICSLYNVSLDWLCGKK